MQHQDRIIINEEELYPTCGICFERFNINKNQFVNDKTPILLNCGHTFCYSCCISIQNSMHKDYFYGRQFVLKCSWC